MKLLAVKEQYELGSVIECLQCLIFNHEVIGSIPHITTIDIFPSALDLERNSPSSVMTNKYLLKITLHIRPPHWSSG